MAFDYLGFYSRHVEGLRKKGKRYIGWCPFHAHEARKRRTFSVNPENGLWWCPSCNNRGNIFRFCRESGIDPAEAPDWDQSYRKYSYAGGGIQYIPHFKALESDGFQAHWAGPRETWNKTAYNLLAVELAAEEKRTLWICEGPKNTETMHEAGELAIGVPSAANDEVLEHISLLGVPEVIMVFDNNDRGERAIWKISDRFPFAKVVRWPNDKWEDYSVTDLKIEMERESEQSPGGLVQVLRNYVVSSDPFSPLTDTLQRKLAKDQSRDPGALLGYDLERFRTLAKNIEGVQPGLYVLAADTNAGKTAFLCNLTLDLLASNKGLSGLFFSLKEHKNKIINRFLSVTTDISLNQIQRQQQSAGQKKILKKGYDCLLQLSKQRRLFVRDAAEIKSVAELEIEFRRHININLFVAIDGLSNLDAGGGGLDLQGEKLERANKLCRLAEIYQIPVICTGELRRKNSRKGADKLPTLGDIMEGEKLVANADLVLLMYPEKMGKYDGEDNALLVLKYAKNKLSHYRGVGKIRFKRITSQVEEYEKD